MMETTILYDNGHRQVGARVMNDGDVLVGIVQNPGGPYPYIAGTLTRPDHWCPLLRTERAVRRYMGAADRALRAHLKAEEAVRYAQRHLESFQARADAMRIIEEELAR